MTGSQVARRILEANNLDHMVNVEYVAGYLSDHYDPTTRVVRLSEEVHDSNSVAAIAIAAHECGHALQHQATYKSLVLRHKLVPVCNIASGLAPLLLFAGLIFSSFNLLLVGVIFFSLAVLFHLVTLPVEFDASKRARKVLYSLGLAGTFDQKGINKVLYAAAFTYVVAALVSVTELMHYLGLLVGVSGRDD
jgi:Zn-dependent membrane protease YugP